ncbi:hypothetical protein OU995_09825 [Roseateles sp. SL47]|uniref:hypothetical protein n=1 Tax=Roseateles sp. SL47 TaxID=2995138 RepID=UPI002272101F|nr:hypothetical protein [Roseateles sp. SL47]WAC74963.1 hypothetical protein OU995_09825 [Roseateles sp. SL47]
MSKYYYPYHHAIRLICKRLVQFILMSVLLGLAVWAGQLHLVLAVDWKTVARANWAMLGSIQQQWRTILGQSMAIGTLLTARLFTWVQGRAGLSCSERHHRGRVIHADAE